MTIVGVDMTLFYRSQKMSRGLLVYKMKYRFI